MTFVSNAVLTAAQLNTHLRDNLLETAPAKATAPGRFIVSTGLNSISEHRLAWRSLTRTATQLVGANSWAVLTAGWALAQADPGDSIGITFSAGVYTVSQPGLYHVFARITTDGTAGAGTYRSRITINGAEIDGSETPDFNVDGTGFFPLPMVSMPALLEANDQVAIEVFHNSISTEAMGAQAGSCFNIVHLGPTA